MDRYKLLMKSIIDNQINKDSIQKFLMFLENSGTITKGFYQQEDFNLKKRKPSNISNSKFDISRPTIL